MVYDQEESIHYIHRTVFVPTSPSRSGITHQYHPSKQLQEEISNNYNNHSLNSPTSTMIGQEVRGNMKQLQQQQQQQPLPVSSPVKKEKRKIVIQSLVSDSLSVIAESSEHSESSISTTELLSPQQFMKGRQQSQIRNTRRSSTNGSTTPSPTESRSRPKRRSEKIDHSSNEKNTTSNSSKKNNDNGPRVSAYKSEEMMQHQLSTPISNERLQDIDEESIKLLEEDHTTDTEKSTKSDHSEEQESSRRSNSSNSYSQSHNSNNNNNNNTHSGNIHIDHDDNNNNDYDDDSLDNSEDSNGHSRSNGSQGGLTSLSNYLKPMHNNHHNKNANDYNALMDVSNMNMMNLSASELATLDGDNSAMLFSYDVEETDEDNSLTNSRHSLGGLRRTNDDEEELSWRLDPSLSMSDWTIIITYKTSKNVEQYYVHKNMLAVGKRKSEYFADIFHQHYKAKSRTNCSEITLPDRAAQIIPMFLDYMYLDEGALSLSSETAPGLRYLSQFFGIKVLFERVMKFIQKDLSLKSLVSYYKGSTDLADRKILGITARHCARNIHLVDVSHPMLEAMDPEFFYKVLSNPALAQDKSLHISLLVAKFCLMHKDRLNGPLFVNLTNPEYVPHIHQTAALSLLSIEADLVVATSLISYMTMSTLQERCIKGLASNWRELTELDPTRTAQVCRKLPAVVVTELLLKSLDHAKTDSNRQSATRVLIKKGGSKGKPNEEIVAIKKEYQDSIDRLKAEYDTKTAHLQQLCYEKDKHIKSYYEELSRYHRLPNAPDGKLVVSGRSVQPTKMPDIGKHPVDGYVLSSKKKDSAKYPVFYYKSD